MFQTTNQMGTILYYGGWLHIAIHDSTERFDVFRQKNGPIPAMWDAGDHCWGCPNLGDQGTGCKLCKYLSSFPNVPFGSIWVVHEIHRNPLRSPHSHIIQLLAPCQMFGNFITPKKHTTPSATIPIPHTLCTSLYIFVHLCTSLYDLLCNWATTCHQKRCGWTNSSRSILCSIVVARGACALCFARTGAKASQLPSAICATCLMSERTRGRCMVRPKLIGLQWWVTRLPYNFEQIKETATTRQHYINGTDGTHCSPDSTWSLQSENTLQDGQMAACIYCLLQPKPYVQRTVP